MKIILVAGARPNFMKIAPLVEEIKKYPRIEPILVHTGQHYDKSMSDVFFREFSLGRPDICLGAGSGSHAEQTAKIMVKFEKVCVKERPNLIILVGDVNSTLACSIVAAKLDYGLRPLIAHVEAGLRSFDRNMPEEINRIVTDSLSDFLFTTSKDANENLAREGIPRERIYFVGNVMIDTLFRFKDEAKAKAKVRIDRKDYALLTLHRPNNVDRPEKFRDILMGLQKISKKIPIIFPAHPRTLKHIFSFRYQRYFNCRNLESSASIKLTDSVNLLRALSYLEFLNLMANSKFVLTDSGGIQEETTILGIPCLTVRENTERPVTIKEGTNRLVGTDPESIVRHSMHILNNGGKKGGMPKLWDGRAAGRIIKILALDYANRRS